MKRLTLWLAISLLAFTLGVAVTIICLARKRPTDIPPLAAIQEGAAAPTECSSFPGLSVKVEGTTSASYFPPRVLDPQPRRDKFIEWYSKHLSAMGEPSLLSRPDAGTEDYRFLWLRSFHHPVAVHIWRSDDKQFLNVKELDGAGGYEPGKLITNRTQSLAKSDWEGFIRLLEQNCFWNLPAENDARGHDGAQWILEGRRTDRYHVVDRWSPDRGTFREACLFLLKLSSLGIDGEYIY